MRRIDEQYLKTPWCGARQMARALRRRGHPVGRKRVGRLMRLMGLRSLAPGPDTSRKHPTHPVHPYLLRDRRIDAPNQVWCADVTYIPLARGFVYLVAIMDWHTRHVLSWQLSITQDASFCLEALDAALERYGKPEIFNTDQGEAVGRMMTAMFEGGRQSIEAYQEFLRGLGGLAAAREGRGRDLGRRRPAAAWSLNYSSASASGCGRESLAAPAACTVTPLACRACLGSVG